MEPGRYEKWRDGIMGGYSNDGTVDTEKKESARGLAGAAVVLVGLIALSIVGHFFAILVVIVVLAAVVMLHELGHFTAAKLSGMKVTEFFLGFGPRLWSTRRGETEYGVRALPFGGFVRVPGMNNLEVVDPADEARTYREATFPRRFIFGVAGSTVHFILALVTVWALLSFGHDAKPTLTIAAVDTFTSQSPAQRAGFQAGEKILSYDGHRASSNSAIRSYIQGRTGVPIGFVIDRGGHDLSLVATPADGTTLVDNTGTPISTVHEGFLGVEFGLANYSLLGAIPHAFRTFWDDGVVAAFSGLGSVFSPHGLASIGHQVVSSPGPASPTSPGTSSRPLSVIGIVQVAGQLPGWAAKALLFFEVNAFVGVLNLLPMLPFDGGHVAIAVYERIRSRKGRVYRADVNKMVPYALAMVAVLAFVSISAIYLDVAHPISLH